MPRLWGHPSSAFPSLILATRLELDLEYDSLQILMRPWVQIPLKGKISYKLRPRHSITSLTPAEKNPKPATKVDFGSGPDELAKSGASSRG